MSGLPPSTMNDSALDSDGEEPPPSDSDIGHEPAAGAAASGAGDDEADVGPPRLDEWPSLSAWPDVVPIGARADGRFIFSASHNVYMAIRTVAECQYGKVKAGRLCELGEDGQYRPTGAPVALKIMRRSNIAEGRTIKGVRCSEDPMLELKALDFLHGVAPCEYILHVVEVLATDEYLIAVLEWADGGDLFDALRASPTGRFDEGTTRDIIRQILIAVHHCHELNVAHRDLSIENVILAEPPAEGVAPSVRVIDFGLAAEMPRDASQPHEPYAMHPFARHVVGKVAYMAPEVYAGQVYNGVKADMWSIGIVMFVLLTGVPPYQTPTAADARFMFVARGRVIDMLRSWRMDGWFSDQAKDLLVNLISREPGDRPDVAQALCHPWLMGAVPRPVLQLWVLRMERRYTVFARSREAGMLRDIPGLPDDYDRNIAPWEDDGAARMLLGIGADDAGAGEGDGTDGGAAGGAGT